MSSRRRAAAGVPSTIGAPAPPAAAPPPADARALVGEAVRFLRKSRPTLRAALERFGELEIGKGYEIVGPPLGEGSYGSVRRVEFTVPERLRPDGAPAPASWRVRGAVKVPHVGREARDDAFEAVLEGATAVAALQQALAGGARYEPFARAAAAAPIVRVYGWLPLPDGRVGVVMEELAGSLAEYIAGPLFAKHYPRVADRAGYARYVARRLLDALGALRAAGFHHCDLKAQNVGLRGDGIGPPEPALIDFGAAKDANLPMDYHHVQTLLLPACVLWERLDPAARPPVSPHPCACSETSDAVNLLAIAQEIVLAGQIKIPGVDLCVRYAGMIGPGTRVAGVDAASPNACLDERERSTFDLRRLVYKFHHYDHAKSGPLDRLAADPWFVDAPREPPAPATTGPAARWRPPATRAQSAAF